MPKKATTNGSSVQPSVTLSDSDRRFRQLFWAARVAHGAGRSADAAAACTDHVAASEFARQLNWDWVDGLLRSSANAWAGHLVEAAAGLDQVQGSVPPQHLCLVVFLRASLAFLNKDHDAAIAYCRTMLKDATFDRRGYVYTNMGESHVAKDQLSDAIKCYRAALDEADYDCPAYALNNLGRLLLEKKKSPKEAVKVLSQAVNAEPEHVRSEGLYYLGRAYRELGDTKNASECFRRSLEFQAPNEWFQLFSARELLELRNAGNSKASLSSDDLSLLKWKGDPSDSVGVKVSPELRAAVKIFRAKETQYDKYMRLSQSVSNGEIHTLRGWSSAVTLVEGSRRRWRGGGYFIKWKGQGIVVDPGFDFLRNFHDAGFHAAEINAVVVTHNHPDHNADLKSIDDLCYEVHKRQEHQVLQPYQLLLDEDTRAAEYWTGEKQRHRSDPVNLDHGRCSPIGEYTSPSGAFRIRYFKVKHGPDVPRAIGCCLDLLDNGVRKVRVGFTGDTEFFPELPSYLADCDILVAHISQPSVEELHDPTERKQIHLGYRGLIELVRLAKPRLTLVGEFWAGLEDLRIDLVDGVRTMSANPNVFPTSIGMTVSLESGRISCSTCKIPVLPEKVRVTSPTELFGSLGYYCPMCTLG